VGKNDWLQFYRRELLRKPTLSKDAVLFAQSQRELKRAEAEMKSGRPIHQVENECNSWIAQFPSGGTALGDFHLNYGLAHAVAAARRALLSNVCPDRDFRVFVTSELLIEFKASRTIKILCPTVRIWAIREDDADLWGVYGVVADNPQFILDKSTLRCLPLKSMRR
jgi:hypothetical protein